MQWVGRGGNGGDNALRAHTIRPQHTADSDHVSTLRTEKEMNGNVVLCERENAMQRAMCVLCAMCVCYVCVCYVEGLEILVHTLVFCGQRRSPTALGYQPCAHTH